MNQIGIYHFGLFCLQSFIMKRICNKTAELPFIFYAESNLHECFHEIPVAYFTKEANTSLAKLPLNFHLSSVIYLKAVWDIQLSFFFNFDIFFHKNTLLAFGVSAIVILIKTV